MKGVPLGGRDLEDNGFAVRGVIEGFYGKPWTHKQRLDLLEFMEGLGYNFFVYAPKDDPYHRAWWDRLYPDERMGRVQELVESCSQRNIKFSYCIAPGLSIVYSSDKHVDALYNKLNQLYQAGVKHFGILFDDVPRTMNEQDQKAFPSLATAQAHVANEIAERMRALDDEIAFAFCPTEYHGEADRPYLRELGAALDPSIMVYWTGPQICSERIDADDAKNFAAILGRKPLYWDNYPVNDAAMIGELHIRPYQGRSSELSALAQGMVLNPMPLFEASKIALSTAAQFFTSPHDYDPEAAFDEALTHLGISPDAQGAWRFFADTVRMSPIELDDHSRFTQTVSQGMRLLRRGRAREGLDVLDALFKEGKQAVATIRSDVETTSKSNLVTECEPWLSELDRWCELGQKTVELLVILFDREEGEELHPDDAQLQQALASVRKGFGETVDFTTHAGGHAVLGMMRDILVRIQARQARGVVDELGEGSD